MSSNIQDTNNEPVRVYNDQPHTNLENLSIGFLNHQYGDVKKVNLRPKYQRPYAWNIDNHNLLVLDIMLGKLIPSIVIYKLHDDDRQELSSPHIFEVIDGQHRLTTIRKYINSEPITIGKKDYMTTWYDKRSDCYVFYKKNDYTEKWANENTDKKVSYMTEEEKSHFTEQRIPIDLIKSKLTYQQRCEMFVSLQSGKLVRNSDLCKNYVDIPLISHIHRVMNAEDIYLDTIFPHLITNSRKNWVFCIVRLFMIILERNKTDDWVNTSDTEIKKKLVKRIPKIMNITKEQIQDAEIIINNWFSCVGNLDKDIIFIPIKMLSTFVYFIQTDVDESNLVNRLIGWAGKGTTEKKRMWYQKDYIEKESDGTTLQYKYYDECLNYLLSGALPEKQTVNKRKRFTKKQRGLLWEREFGNDENGSCHTCGKNIKKTTKWHAGHITSHAKGGSDDDMDNFIVQCRKCNLQCGPENALTYKENNYEVV